MNPQAQDAETDEGLSCSLLRVVQDERKIEQLRKELSSFSHRCRNVLSGMKMSLYLIRRDVPCSLPAWWEEIERNYRGLEHLLDELQSIYRPMPLTLVRAPFRSLVHDRESSWRDWFSCGHATLEIIPPAEEAAGDLDPMCLRMGCDAFFGWRASALLPGQIGRLAWHTNQGWLHACWQEQPPEPGPNRRTRHDPSGQRVAQLASDRRLALPMLARVVKAHGGSIQWARVPAFQVSFGWPLEQAPPCAGTVS